MRIEPIDLEGSPDRSRGSYRHLVTFGSPDICFLMTELCDSDPLSDRRDVMLEFMQVDKDLRPVREPVHFDLILDPVNLDLIKVDRLRGPSRPVARVPDLVDELLRDLPKETRTAIQDHRTAVDKKNILDLTFMVQSIRAGGMFPYSEAFGRRDSVFMGGRCPSFELEREGTKHFIEDLYCMNPECECRETKLVFLVDREDGHHPAELFDVRMTFGGDIRISNRKGITKRKARGLFRAFLDAHPDMVDIIVKRDKKMKSLGGSVLEWNGEDMERDNVQLTSREGVLHVSDRSGPLPASGSSMLHSGPKLGRMKKKVGRNDPCPCGSGKKYKKCCGGPWK